MQKFFSIARLKWYELKLMEEIIYRIAIGLPGFLIGIVFHEYAHAWMAERFGDSTAKHMGRLTLNPGAHLDPIGTVVFPLIGAFLGGAMFGWAKPVPVDSRRFKNIRSGIFWVSFAGPLANLILMVLCAFLFALVVTKVPASFEFQTIFSEMLKQAIIINIILAVFNLIPFPPLDGSKMVSTFLDYNAARKFEDLQRFSFVFVIILWVTPLLQYIMAPAFLISNIIVNLFITILGS